MKRRLLLPLLLVWTGLWGAACGDTETQQPNTPACEASTDCAQTDDGKLCVEGACEACASDAECRLDPAYASSRPFCRDGVCAACRDGDLSCACLQDSTCNQGECVDGTCTDCARGDADCVCLANGTCEAGFICGDSGLCEACQDGVETCGCRDDDSCDGTLVCEQGLCVPNTCVDGETGCPCANGDACSQVGDYCAPSGLCQPCSSDIEGCPCEADSTCLGQNFCQSDDTCAACPASDRPGTCGCMASTDCASGLVCDATQSTCRPAVACTMITCAPFQLCDESAGDAVCADACEAGYDWDSGTMTCVPQPQPETCTDANGDPTPEADACTAQGKECVVENDVVVCQATCRTLSCDTLNRECVLGVPDAVCGMCRPGFQEVVDPMDANRMICTRDPNANCMANDPDSILAACTAENRSCRSFVTGGAACGDCAFGYFEDPVTQICLSSPRCGGEICANDEYCYFPQNGATPSCETRCPAGQAFDPGTSTCTTCNVNCGGDTIYGTLVDGQCACTQDVFCAYKTDGTDDRCQVSPCAVGEASADGSAATCTTCSVTCGTLPGQANRIWPWRDRSGNCFCETTEGSYMAYGQNAQPRACDSDRDGWITQTAEQAWQDANNSPYDPAIVANFRCDRREVDRVVLRNEYRQNREIGICGGNVLNWAPGQMPAICSGAPEVVALSEPDILDSGNLVVQNPVELPAYAGMGFAAGSLNPLTKGCATLSADYNLNGREDVIEVQPTKASELTWINSPGNDDLLFAAASYFSELHTGFYRSGSGSVGTYHVVENQRCNRFGPTYAVGRDLYWEGCLRQRRADFDLMGDRAGMDFAAYGCAATTGTCDLPPGEFLATGMSADGDNVEDHDVCALASAGLLPLPDEPWLGMNHHSQFQCIQVSNGGAGHQVMRSALRGGGANPAFDFNACVLGRQLTAVGEPQPKMPEFNCSYQAADIASVPDDAVGLVSANFSHLTTYDRGCINESLGTSSDVTPPSVEVNKGFSRLCMGFTGSGVCLGNTCTTAVASSGNTGDFGKLVCGCNENYSGSSCEVSCTDNGLHYGGSDNNDLTVAERALYACIEVEPSVSYYCRERPPEGAFAGGVRGAWLCGEFTQTMSISGTDPTMTGSVNGQSAALHGNIRSVSVTREPLSYSTANGTFTLY